MAKKYAVHFCSFTAVDLTGKDRYDYEKVKAAVLQAGRFSSFEASENSRTAAVYDRLQRDPDIETWQMSFPWVGVKPAVPSVDRVTPR